MHLFSICKIFNLLVFITIHILTYIHIIIIIITILYYKTIIILNLHSYLVEMQIRMLWTHTVLTLLILRKLIRNEINQAPVQQHKTKSSAFHLVGGINRNISPLLCPDWEEEVESLVKEETAGGEVGEVMKEAGGEAVKGN